MSLKQFIKNSILFVLLVFVYEVNTGATRFQTVSKLGFKSFLYYNGGTDVIKSLKVVKVYDDSDFKKALKDFKIEDKNYKKLLPIPTNNHFNYRYIWWR